jgi:hypothetical protein
VKALPIAADLAVPSYSFWLKRHASYALWPKLVSAVMAVRRIINAVFFMSYCFIVYNLLMILCCSHLQKMNLLRNLIHLL